MVNYPHFVRRQTTPPRKKSEKNTVNFANRGMSFEAAINETNNYYLSRDIAVIYKKPTPIQIVKVEAELRLWKLIFDKPLLPITLASIRDIMLTLKLKKLGKRHLCRSKIFMRIK